MVGLDGWLVGWWCCLPECSLMVLLYERGDPFLSLKHRSVHAEHEVRTQLVKPFRANLHSIIVGAESLCRAESLCHNTCMSYFRPLELR
jgi:hypothetical protein